MVKWRGFPSPSLVLRISRRAEHFTGYYQAQDGDCRWKSKGGHIEKKKRMREKRQRRKGRGLQWGEAEENGVSSYQGAGSLVEVVQHWAKGYNPILETFPASKLPLTVHRLYHHWRWACLHVLHSFDAKADDTHGLPAHSWKELVTAPSTLSRNHTSSITVHSQGDNFISRGFLPCVWGEYISSVRGQIRIQADCLLSPYNLRKGYDMQPAQIVPDTE